MHSAVIFWTELGCWHNRY